MVVGGKKYKFHLVPSGALKGKKLLIGAGVALDPVILKGELELLSKMHVAANLMVDGRCSLVSPLEKDFDGFLDNLRGSGAIGTTRMGIGPAYAARALRISPRAMDLFSRSFDLRNMLRFYRSVTGKRTDLRQWLRLSRSVLRSRLGDVSSAVRAVNERGGAVLFEGAQGTMLDLLHGTYPYVTSSSTISSNTPTGLGLSPDASGEVIGVTKAYVTRVGSGPFPTEQEGGIAEVIRQHGNEFGTTTGRPRRIGWLDLVALKYAVKLNGAKELALTKVDVLSKVRNPRVCVAYGRGGSESDDFYKFMVDLDAPKPVYESLPSLYGTQFTDGLPGAARKLVDKIEQSTGATVKLLSYGEERTRTHEL